MFFLNVTAYECGGPDPWLVSTSHWYCLIVFALQNDVPLWPCLPVNEGLLCLSFLAQSLHFISVSISSPAWVGGSLPPATSVCDYTSSWAISQKAGSSTSEAGYSSLLWRMIFFFFLLTMKQYSLPTQIHVAQQAMLLNIHYPNISLRSLGILIPKHLLHCLLQYAM